MPKVTFGKSFVWRPHRGVRISYRAGCEYPVTRRCLQDAKDANVPVKVREGGNRRHDRSR